MSVELDGDVGCYNLLVRAVQLCDELTDSADEPSWCYVAQELRRIDDIDGSAMQMLMTHKSTEQSAVVCSLPAESRCAEESVSVKKLLLQFPSVLPASLPQFLVSPSALPAVHGEAFCIRSLG